METPGKVKVFYDEFLCDELSIGLFYRIKDNIDGFEDEKGNPVSKSQTADWIMNNYYNDRKFWEYCGGCKGRMPESGEELYQWDEGYRKSVDEERLYLLYLIGIQITKIAKIFGVSRQTVYSRLKSFEENRLHEFIRDGRGA